MKRGLLCIICTVCLFLFFQIPSTAETIAGFPVIEETEQEAGSDFDWKILPPEEKENGFIKSYAFDGGDRCAILVNEKIMVYDQTTCIFKCQFRTEGSCQLSFWNGNLILYSVRDECLLTFDFETSKLKEYRLDDTCVEGYEVSEALEEGPGDLNTNNGFYVTNHLGNRFFTIGYDTLVYVKDGTAQTVYTSYEKVIGWVTFAIVFISVGTFFLVRLYKRKKNRQ